jgi:hypothetical protein
VAGITGDAYTDPVAFEAGYRVTVVIGAALLVLAALVAFLFVRTGRTPAPAGEPDGVGDERVALERCPHCGITSPQMYPSDRS